MSDASSWSSGSPPVQTTKRCVPAVAGHFLQIWETDAGGAWKLALDWQQMLPKQ